MQPPPHSEVDDDGPVCEWYDIATARSHKTSIGSIECVESLRAGSRSPPSNSPQPESPHIPPDGASQSSTSCVPHCSARDLQVVPPTSPSEETSRLASQLLDMSLEVGRCLEESKAVRPRLAALSADCGPGGLAASASSSMTPDWRDDENHVSDETQASCVNSDEGTAPTPTRSTLPSVRSPLQAQWDKCVSLVDEKQANVFNLQWNLVRDHMQAISTEVATLREDIRSIVEDTVAEQVSNHLRSPMDSIQQARWDLHLESALRRSEDERIEKMASQLQQDISIAAIRKPTDDSSEKRHCDDIQPAKSSLTNQVHTSKEQNMAVLDDHIKKQVQSYIVAESARWEASACSLEKQLKAMSKDLEKEGSLRDSGDKENASLISQTSLMWQQALDRERQERQCMCSLVALTSQDKNSESSPSSEHRDLASAMHEALRGLFASVSSLQAALGREAELRVSGCEEVQQISRSLSEDVRVGLASEIQSIWKALSSHSHEVKVEPTGRSASSSRCPPSHRLLPTDQSKQKAAAPMEPNRTGSSALAQSKRKVGSSSVALHMPSARAANYISLASPVRSPSAKRPTNDDGESLQLRSSAAFVDDPDIASLLQPGR